MSSMAEETAPVAKKSRRKKLWLVVGIIVLVVAAAGAGIALRWWQTRDEQREPVPTPALPAVVRDLQNLRDTEDPEVVDEEIRKALDNPSLDTETRYMLYLQQGHAYSDRGDWQPAIDAYLKAEKLQQTYEVAELLAGAYRQSGDSAKAIEYYRKAVNLIPQESPVKEATRDLLETQISELEAQQQ